MEPWARSFDPPFRLTRPARQTVPVVLNAPHSGRIYPEAFLHASRLGAHELRRSEDAHVEALFAHGPALGAPLLEALFPRAFLDVNREPFELDPHMFDGPLPAHANTGSLRVAAGLGTIPRVVSEQEEIYRRKLHPEEAEERLTALYFPYHAALDGLMRETRASFGAALLLDCHSMPESAASAGLAQPRLRPDIVLGDRHGSAAAHELTDALEQLLADQGLKVGRNRPYAGGFITQTHGKPSLGSHAIQIEICRSLYMDEASLSLHSGFAPLQTALTQVLAELFSLLPALLAPGRLAAE